MADNWIQEHKNRCYLFNNNGSALWCKVCGSRTISRTYSYYYRNKEIKGLANYCSTCKAFYIYYGNYISNAEYWDVLDSKDEIKKMRAAYQKMIGKTRKNRSKKEAKRITEKYYEIPGMGKRLEQERIKRNKRAEKNKKREEQEKQKIIDIKKKLESKEALRIQQLKEFEKKREKEFNRRLAESRRRSMEKKKESQSIEKTDSIHTVTKSQEKKVSKSIITEPSARSDNVLRERQMSNGHMVSNKQAELNKTAANSSRIIKDKNESNNHEITAHDFVVRSSSSVFRCRNKFHKLQDIQAIFRSISRIGTVREIEIPAGYCPECNIYFILESTFERIKQSGVPICRTMDEKTYVTNINNGNSMDISLAQESVLMQFGYTVSQTEDLPMIQRRAILAAIVDYHVLTKNEVISYLDSFIRFRRNQKNSDGSLRYQAAIEKWNEDREFISKYQIGNYTKVAMKRIITNKE